MPPSTATGRHDRTRWIVVAEPDVEMRATLVRALSDQGARVVVARTGREIIDAVHLVELWRGGTVELLVVDHDLPEMSGLVALRRLREEGFHIPTVLTSAAADRTARAQAKAYDAPLLHKSARRAEIEAAAIAAKTKSFPGD